MDTNLHSAFEDRSGWSTAGDKPVSPGVGVSQLESIRGIGVIYAELLEAAGVATVLQLSAWNPAELYAWLREVGRDHEPPVFRLPSLREVTSWVMQARAGDANP